MSKKMFETQFTLSAQIDNAFGGAFNSAQQAMSSFQNEIRELNRTQSDISSFEKQQTAVENSKNKITLYEQQLANLKKEYEETGSSSAVLQNKMLDKERQIDKTTEALRAQEERLSTTGEKLREAGVNTDNLGNASKQTAAKVEELKREQERAAEAAQQMGDSSSQAIVALHGVLIATGVVKLVGALKDSFLEARDAAMEYEASMSIISAVTGANADYMGMFSATVRQTALDTGLAVQDLAQSARDLMEVGSDMNLVQEQLVSGAELAIATNSDLGLSYDFLSSAMKTFKMDVAATQAVSDSFAYTTVKTNTDLGELAAAYVNVGGAAVNAGLDIDTINAKLVIMAEAGLRGGAAGTSLNGILRNLSAPTEKAAAEFDRLEISLYDLATGASRDMLDIMSDLEAATASMTDEQRNRTQSIIFDNVALKGWNMITADGIDSVRELSAEISKSSEAFNGMGQAAGMAATATDNLQNSADKATASSNELRMAFGESFTPIMRQYYDMQTQVNTAIAKFVQENPDLVRGMTAFVAVLGVATVGVVGYKAAVVALTAAKKALAISSMAALGPIGWVALAVAGLVGVFVGLSSRVQDTEAEYRSLSNASKEQYRELRDLEQRYANVCSTMGETSVEAQLLKKELDELTDAFDKNKRSAEEAAAAHHEAMSAYSEYTQLRMANVKAIEDEAAANESLMQRLKDLYEDDSRSAAQTQEMLSIIEIISERMPELNLSYDEYHGTLNTTAEAVALLAAAESERAKQLEHQTDLNERLAKHRDLEQQATTDLYEKEAAIRALIVAQQEYDDALEALEKADPFYGSETQALALSRAQQALVEARDAVDDWTEAHERSAYAVENNADWIDYLSGQVANCEAEINNFEQSAEEANRTMFEMGILLEHIEESMAALTEAYDAVYQAALTSVQGQYNIWDTAAKVVATSADTINKALESQIEYWQGYNRDLQSLGERTSDIEGLGEMIGSFADGSADSVNAIKGMANATDEELSAMVLNWQELQKEHDAVATSMGELVTDFSKRLGELESELESTISNMNMTDEAAAAARNTIQGFIDGAVGMTEQVEAAYGGIARAAMDAIDRQLQIKSPSKEMEYRAEMTWIGYIKKTQDMEKEVTDAMGATAKAGSEAVTAGVNVVTLAPEFAAALSARGGGSTSGGVSVSVTYNIDGVSGADEEALRVVFAENNEKLVDVIMDAIEERQRDSLRRQ